VDFVCRGNGEQLLLDLVDTLEDPSDVAGVTWQETGGTLRHNPNRNLERNLDQWPFPDREGLSLDFVESMPLDVPAVLSMDRFTTMQTSRGCPWPCVFCDIPIFNEGKWRSCGCENGQKGTGSGRRSGFCGGDSHRGRPHGECCCRGVRDPQPGPSAR
jgi:anaerobic magnesium-protoporphyrin IX monomethyl ester cyclase